MNMKVFEGHSFNEFRERVEGKDIEIASAIYEAIKKGYNRKAKQITAFNLKPKAIAHDSMRIRIYHHFPFA